MLTLVDERIETYARDNSSAVPDLMKELEAYTFEHTDYPTMQVGDLEGAFLRFMVKLTGAKRILEVGTFTGYSALMMAQGLPNDGELITCDVDPETTQIAQTFFNRSPHGKKIRIRLGDAMETIDSLQPTFDLAFIDADKKNYIRYFEKIVPLMRKGGLILVDNVLWSGRVIDPASDPENESTEHLIAFNDYLKQRTDLERVMLTVRDGITMVLV